MAQHTLDTFQAIADPSRRQILRMLSKKTCTINAIAENFDMSRPAVSKHIKVLETTGFIAVVNKGRERHCQLSQEGFDDLRKWIDYFDQFWESKMKRLGDLLDAKKA